MQGFFFRKDTVFPAARLNILIFLPILSWKYSCEYSKFIAYEIPVFDVFSVWIMLMPVGLKAFYDTHNFLQKCYQISIEHTSTYG